MDFSLLYPPVQLSKIILEQISFDHSKSVVSFNVERLDESEREDFLNLWTNEILGVRFVSDNGWEVIFLQMELRGDSLLLLLNPAIIDTFPNSQFQSFIKDYINGANV